MVGNDWWKLSLPPFKKLKNYKLKFAIMEEEKDDVKIGMFEELLRESGKQIKDRRAKGISEDAKMAYKTMVETLGYDVRKLQREQEDSLDFAPDNVFSIISAKSFEPDVFAQKDADLGVRIRNAKVKFITAARRYKYLFGENVQMSVELLNLMDKEVL